MNISDYIAFGSLVMSVVTAACSYASYRKYGRKLNEQQTQINEFIIAQQEKEDLKNRCANLKCDITSHKLIVKNEGMADASDIEISFKSDAIIHPSEFPITIKSISAGDSFDIRIFRAESIEKSLLINISWVDGRGVRQSVERNVSLI